jgi:hypothetical protein
VKIIKLDGDINVSHSVSGGYNRLFETFEEIDYKFSRQFIVCNEYKRSREIMHIKFKIQIQTYFMSFVK